MRLWKLWSDRRHQPTQTVGWRKHGLDLVTRTQQWRMIWLASDLSCGSALFRHEKLYEDWVVASFAWEAPVAKNSQKKDLAVEINQELFHIKLHPLQTLRLDQFLRAVRMGSTPTSQAFRCRRETLGSDRRQMEGATKKTGTRNGRQRGFARKLAGLAVQSP